MSGRRPKPPVRRVRGGFRVDLDGEERDLLRRLLGELRAMLLDGQERPVLARLFPAAYNRPEDAELDAEYHRLMKEELVASRLAGIEIVEKALAGDSVLSAADLDALMQAVNGLRLVLGTLLDVSDDDDPASVPDSHPMVGEYQLYGFLSWLLDWTLRALTTE